MKIEEIYRRWIPVPDARGDRIVFEFLVEVKDVVLAAIKQIEDQVKARQDAKARV